MTTLETRPATTPGTPYDQLEVVPARHPGRWVATAAVAVLLAMVLNSLVTNPRWEWGVVGAYLTEESIVRGVVTTVQLTAWSSGDRDSRMSASTVPSAKPSTAVISVSWIVVQTPRTMDSSVR